MKGLVFINVLLLVLFANTIESRHEPGEHHWRNLINHKLIHEANEDLIRSDPNSLLSKKKMDDCTETLKLEDGKLFVEPRPQATFYRGVVEPKLFAKNIKPRSDNPKTKLFVEDIELRPSIKVYLDEIKTKLAKDVKLRSSTSFHLDDTKTKIFAKDIEPRPNVSFYPDDDTKTKLFVEDVEPRPKVSFYPDDDTKTKLFVKDVEPRPNVSFYPDDETKTKLFVEDIEPRPNVSFYPNDNTKTKLFVEEIEPQPNVTFYPDENTKTKLFVEDVEPRPNVSFYPNNLKAKEHSIDDAHHGEADIQMVQA